MVLESTIICADNSEYMRNGDFLPSRLQAQQEAVSLICHSKTRSNPENNVGLLITGGHPQVLATLTSDTGRILAKLHQVQPQGDTNLSTSIRIAHLALKHRQGRNHKMRIIVFIGSPLKEDEKELVKLAKRLKKEKVNVDIINFGEETLNTEKLTTFINTINGKDGTGSHLVTVPPGPHLSDALMTSPIVQNEDGTGGGGAGMGGGGAFDFGIDPNEDPELALALRVSMEEQRQRQEEEARRAGGGAEGGAGGAAGGASETPMDAQQQPGAGSATDAANPEDALLQRALNMPAGSQPSGSAAGGSAADDVNFASMTEEEQLAYALQMSLHQSSKEAGESEKSPEPMDTDDAAEAKKEPEVKKEEGPK